MVHNVLWAYPPTLSLLSLPSHPPCPPGQLCFFFPVIYTYIVLCICKVQDPEMGDNMSYLSFLDGLNLLNVIISACIHFSASDLFFFKTGNNSAVYINHVSICHFSAEEHLSLKGNNRITTTLTPTDLAQQPPAISPAWLFPQ